MNSMTLKAPAVPFQQRNQYSLTTTIQKLASESEKDWRLCFVYQNAASYAILIHSQITMTMGLNYRPQKGKK